MRWYSASVAALAWAGLESLAGIKYANSGEDEYVERYQAVVNGLFAGIIIHVGSNSKLIFYVSTVGIYRTHIPVAEPNVIRHPLQLRQALRLEGRQAETPRYQPDRHDLPDCSHNSRVASHTSQSRLMTTTRSKSGVACFALCTARVYFNSSSTEVLASSVLAPRMRAPD